MAKWLTRWSATVSYTHLDVYKRQQLDVQIVLPDPALRRSYELVFVEGDALARDIRLRLEDQRVELPVHLAVQIELVTELSPAVAARGFDVHYGSIPAPQPSEKVMEVRLTVITGSAEEQQHCLKKKRIHLGRLAEVIDADGRLTRKNDVAHSETTGTLPTHPSRGLMPTLSSIPRGLCSASSMIGAPMEPLSSGMAP